MKVSDVKVVASMLLDSITDTELRGEVELEKMGMEELVVPGVGTITEPDVAGETSETETEEDSEKV